MTDDARSPHSADSCGPDGAAEGDRLVPADAVAGSRRQVARVTTEEHWELVRSELLPMYIERRTLAEIAEAFGVSSNTASAWRARLIDDLRSEASTLSPRDFIVECMTSLRLARAEAWKTVRDCDDLKGRRAGLQLVAQIENQSVKLGAMIGLYGRAGDQPLRSATAETDDGAEHIRAMMIEFLGCEENVPPN